MLLLVLPALLDSAGFSAATWSRHASSETLAALLGIGSSCEFQWPERLESRFSRGRAQLLLVIVLIAFVSLRALPLAVSHVGIFDTAIAFIWGLIADASLGSTRSGQFSRRMLSLGLVILNSLLAISSAFSAEPRLRAGFITAYLLASVLVVVRAILRARQEEHLAAARGTTVSQTEGLTLDLLSKRERDVFESLAAGNSQAATATSLGLSPSTVGTYRARALKKLGLSSIPAPPTAESLQLPGLKVTDRFATFTALGLCTALFTTTLLLGALPDSIRQTVGFFACELAALVGLALLSPNQLDESPHKSCGSTITHLAFFAFTALLVRESLICEPNPILSGAALAVCLAVLTLCLLKGKTISLPAAITSRTFLAGPLFSSVLLFRQFPGCAKSTVYVGPLPVVPELLRDALILAFIASLVYLTLTRLIEETDEPPAEPQLDGLRCLSYLAGRGLNQTQSEVALAIAQGKSQSQISNDLHLARGTVNSARLVAYRKLAITNREQLVDLLRRDTCPK